MTDKDNYSNNYSKDNYSNNYSNDYKLMLQNKDIKDYDKKQKTLIDKQNQDVSLIDEPYIRYLKDTHTENNGKIRYITQYINIDSSFRTKTYEPQIENSYILVNNPLQFFQNNIRIYYNNTDIFKINENILLQGIEKKQLCLRSVIYNIFGNQDKYFYFNGDVLYITAPTLIEKNNKRTDAKITINNYEGDIRREIILDLSNYQYSFINNRFKIYTSDNEQLLADFDIDIYGTVISINNDILNTEFVVPNTIYNTLIYFQNEIYEWIYKNNVMQTNFVGNISLTYINKTHNMILNNSNDSFSIHIPNTYYRNEFTFNNPFDSNYIIFTVYEENISDVTLTYEHYGGISIDTLTSTQYPIKNISKNRYIDIFIDDYGKYIDLFGGNNVSINKINYEPYYPLSNQYFINLEKTYTEIVKIKMVSSCFPKLYYNVTNKNNKLYWQIENENIINMIEIDEGYYKDIELQKILETLMNNTDRNHFMKIIINKKTNIVNFRCYKSINNVSLSILSLNEINNSDRLKNMTFYIYPDGDYYKNHNLSDTYILTIYYVNHNVRLNDTIIVANNEYTVIYVTQNSFDISIDNNIDINNIDIVIPVRFCLRFDFSSTICKLLGFNNTVTDYDYIIKNTIKNILQEPSYLLILCNEITTNMSSVSYDKDIFYRINFENNCCNTNKDYIYNSFVDAPIYFDDPLRKLNGLTLNFINPDGSLYDFNEQDHSFVLEIVTKENIPLNTHNKKT